MFPSRILSFPSVKGTCDKVTVVSNSTIILLRCQYVNDKSRSKYILTVFIAVPTIVLAGVVIGWSSPEPPFNLPLERGESQVEESELGVTHVELPDEVRGIYWTAVTAGYESNRDYLLNFMLEAGLNAVVIDLKLDNGEIGFLPETESLQEFAQDNPVIEDLDQVLELLAENNIYRIARVPVMRDGAYAVLRPDAALRWPGGSIWQDDIGSLWIDPAYEAAWDYNIELAREAYDRGFDEIQFDYVRFASDGNLSSIRYPVYDSSTETKNYVMARFFAHVGGTLRDEGIPVSFDVFGMTCHSNSGFNIGQRLTDVYPYTDFISPMVYPSHYEWNFHGLGNPAEQPYAIVTSSLTEGTQLLGAEALVPAAEAQYKFRPWLQDFDIGAVYDSYKIQEQIRATREAGASGWIMWNARNVYEEGAYYGL